MITATLKTSSKSRRERKYTADDYRATPEGPPWIQLIDGKFYVSEAPTTFHQSISGKLYLALAIWAERTGAGVVYYAPVDVYLSDHDVVQPDLLFVAKEKMDIFQRGRVYGAPDLVVEILSPSTVALDTVKKRALYARVGVREMWVVDPKSRKIHIYRLREGSLDPIWTGGEGETLTSPVLPGFCAEISGIFSGHD